MKQDNNRAERLIGPALGLMVLLVYSLTLSIGAYPGRSADLVVQHMGLIPKMTPDNPVWSAVVWLVLRLIPIGSAVFRMNFLSALCGAGSVWLLYELVVGVVRSVFKEGGTDASIAKPASTLAGIAAASFLAFCIPFWIVSNRAGAEAFDILLLLLCAWFLMRYAVLHKENMGVWCALLLGAGVAEFATFIVFAPFFGVFLIVLLWRHERLCVSAIAKFAGCALAGLSFYLFAAWAFHKSAGYELRGYSNFFQIIWQMWRNQYFLITRSLPREGWLIILVITVVPWLTCLLVKFRALNGPRDVTYLFLHLVITGCALIVLLNLRLSPWRIVSVENSLVTPYVLMASVYGYLTAYWYMFPRVWWGDRKHGTQASFVGRAGVAMVVPAFLLLAVTPFRNLKEADARPARLIKRMAEETINSMNGRTWLVTDGVMDEQLMLAARGRGIRLLNLSRGNEEVYMKYIADFFESPRLQNLARIGMVPLFQEWLATDPEVENKLAVQTMPDLLVSGDLRALPNKLVFLAVRDKEKSEPADIMAEHRAFWDSTVPFVKNKFDPDGRLAFFGRHFLRHMGFVANNLGVLMEDLGRDKDAFSAYSRAREIDGNNVSALLNQIAMVEKGFATDQADVIRRDLKDLLANIKTRYHVWSLAHYYGYVRSPGAFAELGLTWARSGQAGTAISTMKKALELLPEGERQGVKQRMAGVYLMNERIDESEALYFEVLVEDPDNVQALVGLSRISAAKSDFDKAAELLTRAEEAQAPKVLISFERALLCAASGDVERAEVLLEKLVASQPKFRQAWVAFIDLVFFKNDQEAMERIVERIRNLEGERDDYVFSIAQGKLALMRNDWQKAAEEFEKAVRLDPMDVRLMEILARLATVRDDRNAAMQYVRKLLRLDRNNALANYIMGCMQMDGGQDELAEDSFRRSVETSKTPDALNNLAWLLQKKGDFVEAEQFALEALSLTSDMFQLWDTLGVILMKTGRLDEAERAIDRSLTINPDDLVALLHMAEIQARKGNKAQAVELIDMLARKQQLLSSSDQDRLYDIRHMARKLP